MPACLSNIDGDLHDLHLLELTQSVARIDASPRVVIEEWQVLHVDEVVLASVLHSFLRPREEFALDEDSGTTFVTDAGLVDERDVLAPGRWGRCVAFHPGLALVTPQDDDVLEAFDGTAGRRLEIARCSTMVKAELQAV